MATEIVTSFWQICDSAGDPVSGALINVYAVGTTTPLAVKSDTALTAAAANPIVCDSAGRHDMMYIATGSYKIVVTTAAAATIYTRDGIDGRVPVGSGALAIANGGTGATTAAAAIAALGGATSAEVADIAADVASLSGTLASTEKTHIATGSTGQRPASPIEGDIRRNTTTSFWEFYNGSAWENLVITVSGATPITGTLSVSGLSTLTGGLTTPAAILSSGTTGVGYKTGAGGTQTQSTNKTTTVVLNKITGQITLAAESIGNQSSKTFTLTNSTIALGDIMIFNHVSGGTIGAYLFNAACGAGSASIQVINWTGGALNEQPVMAFAVIKAVTA